MIDPADLLLCALPSFLTGIAAGYIYAYVRTHGRPRP